MELSVPGHNSWPVSEPMLCSSMLNTTTAVANYRYPNVHGTPICAASQDPNPSPNQFVLQPSTLL